MGVNMRNVDKLIPEKFWKKWYSLYTKGHQYEAESHLGRLLICQPTEKSKIKIVTYRMMRAELLNDYLADYTEFLEAKIWKDMQKTGGKKVR